MLTSRQADGNAALERAIDVLLSVWANEEPDRNDFCIDCSVSSVAILCDNDAM